METGSKNPQIEQAINDFRAGVDPGKSFRKIFDFYYPPVHRFFLRKSFSPDEAHDLTQETFFRVYTKIEQFRGEAPFEAWLWQIATNLFRKRISYRQTQKRAGETVSLDDEESGVSAYLTDRQNSTPLDAVLEAEQRRQLQSAIEQLPEQMRKCMKLRVFQDLSYQEIAVVMRISPQTVKAHLFQARRHLRERLGEYFMDIAI